jgi:hypothetical protein
MVYSKKGVRRSGSMFSKHTVNAGVCPDNQGGIDFRKKGGA